MHNRQTVEAVLALAEQGLSIAEIARRTGLPWSTARNWVTGRLPHSVNESSDATFLEPNLVPQSAYAYLLGLYLGDGHIASAPRGVFVLRLYLDAAYPEIVRAAVAAMQQVMPANKVNVRKRQASRCVVVSSSSKRWPTMFPQHGPGRKHDRAIELAAWQCAITHRQARALVRGLIHSDGSRYLAVVRARQKEYHYVRYDFANRSEDIKVIFCEHLDLLGVRWSRPHAKIITVARKAEVAKLDQFVGPKA